jgi:hypothetical protein
MRKPPPLPSTAPTILLGSEAPPSKGLPTRDELASDKEEKTCSDDDFPDIDRLNQTNISVVGGSLSSIVGRIKSKRVKSKESWVHTQGSRIFRKGELH